MADDLGTRVDLQIGSQTMSNVSLRDAAALAHMILGWVISGSESTIAIGRTLKSVPDA